jgi:prepilin-type N-terminal cleavage/methylation domain-containing protein
MSSNAASSGNSIVHASRRRAFTLFEVIIAAAVLAALLTASVQMLRAVSIHQRATEHRAAALQAVQAISDEVANIPWNRLTAESAKEVRIPKPLDGYLPGAKISVSLDEEGAPAPAKRLHVDLTWNGPDGQAVAPVRLTSWIFPDRSHTE